MICNSVSLQVTWKMEGHSQIIPSFDGPKTIMNINKLQSCKIEVVKKFNNVCKRALRTARTYIHFPLKNANAMRQTF